MKSFIIPTESFVKTEKTETTAIASASGSPVAITVKNNQGFIKDDYVIVKREGAEQAHICLIDSVAGNNTITLVVLKHNLVISDQITMILFNQRKVYGCATKDGTYVELSGSPVDIEVDRPDGTLFEYDGIAYIYFKATYYNAIAFTETSLDDAVAISTLEIAHYCSIDDIREESGFKDNDYIDAGRIDALRSQAESEVKSSIGVIYSLPLNASCQVIRTIAKLLAAGWLMWAEYGEEASGTSKDGMAKVTQARSMLKSIREHKLKLYDDNDVELSKVSSPMGTIAGYPNDDTDDEEDAQFTISQKF